MPLPPQALPSEIGGGDDRDGDERLYASRFWRNEAKALGIRQTRATRLALESFGNRRAAGLRPAIRLWLQPAASTQEHGARLRLRAACSPGQPSDDLTRDIASVLSLFSKHSLPLLPKLAADGDTQPGSWVHCEAKRLDDMSWELPLRARWGEQSCDWAPLLLEHFADADPHDLVDPQLVAAVSSVDVDAESVKRLWRRIPWCLQLPPPIGLRTT